MSILMIFVSIGVIAVGILTLHVAENYKSVAMLLMGWMLILVGLTSITIASTNYKQINKEQKLF
jgi:hypothetical protein